ncbi:MAG: hypothetical protein P8X74_19850 [Reinekea sp.]
MSMLIAMMEAGMPEQTTQATRDLQAKAMIPVHWGALTLSGMNQPNVFLRQQKN